MRAKPLTVVEQLTLTQVVYSLTLAAAVGFWLQRSLSASLMESFCSRATAATQDLAFDMSFYVAGGDREGIESSEIRVVLARPDTAYVAILDRETRVLFARSGPAGTPLPDQAFPAAAGAPAIRTRGDVLDVAVPVMGAEVDRQPPGGAASEEDAEAAALGWTGLDPARADRLLQVGTLIVGYSLADVLAAQRRAFGQAALVTLCILAAGIAFNVLLGRSIQRPLSRIAERVEGLTRGELIQDPVPETGQGEIRDLARALNIMTRALEDREDKLRSTNEGLERKVAERTRSLEAQTLSLANANALLQLQTERARAADRAKTDFLATMSHELRTPLNSIIGFTDLLLQEVQGPIAPAQREDLTAVASSARHLLALINDILDLSKVEAGRMELALAPLEPAAVFAELQEVAHGLPRAPGVVLDLDLVPGTPRPVADPKRLRQVGLNLLSNAIKFTERGRVELRLDPAPDGRFRLRVADTGPGIPAEHQERIFEPFCQLDQGAGRQHQGTGLGLTICRRMVDLMGGELRLESEPGRGSTFTVVLPAEGVGTGSPVAGAAPSGGAP